MPATPMKDAADRYSPEMAEAFQPTETERPATKKSLAVFDRRADQKPMPTVTTTVMKEKVKIQGSTLPKKARNGVMAQRCSFPLRCAPVTSSSSSAIERRMKTHEMIQTNGKNSTPRTSQLNVKPPTRVAICAGAK